MTASRGVSIGNAAASAMKGVAWRRYRSGERHNISDSNRGALA